jgi:glycosyltransferase involved in cell wall biosynthesis
VFLVGIIARLSDVKGHLYLIRAMQKVIKIFPNTKLLIVGQGKMYAQLIKETYALNIKDKVVFISQADNINEMLSAMDVFVMPSLQEGLGLALMEAMAQGLPVVGSAVGGIKTLIQDKVNGLLVSPANVEELAQAILKLLPDSQQRVVLGANARKFIMENFSKIKMVDKTEKFYKN